VEAGKEYDVDIAASSTHGCVEPELRKILGKY
jgi:hypothetical protein